MLTLVVGEEVSMVVGLCWVSLLSLALQMQMQSCEGHPYAHKQYSFQTRGDRTLT